MQRISELDQLTGKVCHILPGREPCRFTGVGLSALLRTWDTKVDLTCVMKLDAVQRNTTIKSNRMPET